MVWLAIKLFLGGALKRLTDAIGSVFRAVVAHPKEAAIIASLCLSVWLWRGRQEARVEAARWEQAFVDQKAGYEKAQADATQAQLAADAREFDLKTLLAEKADDLSRLSTERTRVAVADYAGRMRCEAPRGAPGGTGGAGLPGDPGQPPDEAPAPELVAIARPDLDALAEGAVQNAAKTEFLIAAIEAGWAVPQSVAFGN